MENELYTKNYKAYISALKELADAQKTAREFFPSIPLYPVEQPPDLTLEGKAVFQRLITAYEVYAEKYKVWKNSLAVYEL
jgi:hypothetical protein